MTFADQFALCQPATVFMKAVEACANRIALGVMGESYTVHNHETRQTLANQILQDPSNAFGAVTALAWMATSDGATDASVTNAALQIRMQAIWDATAGMRLAENLPYPTATDGSVTTTVSTVTALGTGTLSS